MRKLVLFSITAATLGLCGFDRQDEPGFSFWATGDGALAYHHISGDCDEIEHAYGRNAAWGLWRLPLARVIVNGPEETEGGGAVLRFRCADASACIGQGRLEETPEQTGDHAIPFGDMDRARAFAGQVSDLKAACGL